MQQASSREAPFTTGADNRFRISPVLYLLAVFLILWGDVATAQGPPRPGAPPPPLVTVARVTSQAMVKTTTLVGTVRPSKRTLVASEIAGLVAQFPIEEGDRVRKGQILARLKTDLLELELAAAEASLRETRARHTMAERQLQRIENLFQEGLATDRQLEEAQTEEKTLKEAVAQLQAQIAQLQTNIDQSQIRAPFEGLIVRTFSEIGSWISQGGPVAELVDIDTVRVEVSVPEEYVGALHIGKTVHLRFEALPEFRGTGQIQFIVPEADPSSRTFPVRVTLENPDHKVKPGMMARATFSIGEPRPVTAVPKDALVLQGGRYLVFVVSENKVAPVPVQVGTMTDRLAEVQGPVEAGQLVVVKGNERLRPGQDVRIMEEGTP